MSTHNICFHYKIRKKHIEFPLFLALSEEFRRDKEFESAMLNEPSVFESY